MVGCASEVTRMALQNLPRTLRHLMVTQSESLYGFQSLENNILGLPLLEYACYNFGVQRTVYVTREGW